MGIQVFGAISHVGPATWGLELENGHLSPGVVWSRVAAQPSPVPWACTLGTLVLRAISPVGPQPGVKLGKRYLPPGVVRSHVAAQPSLVP